MDFITDILQLTGALADASWNGVPFYMPDSRHETGRRVQRFFFPGQDVTAYQDMGAFDGEMHIRGLIVGDLYIQDGQALEAALRTPGPGTLVHPWFGSLQMVLTQPASITYSQHELRVVRFEATFAPFTPQSPPATSTLDDLLDDISDAFDAAQSFMAAALAPIGAEIWPGSDIESFFDETQSYWQAATGAIPTFGALGNPQLAAACAPAIAALSGVDQIAPGADYPGSAFALLSAVPQAIVSASQTLNAPAVGPGDAAVATTPIDGRITMNILLAASNAAMEQLN